MPTQQLSVQCETAQAYYHLLPQHPVSWLADMQSEPQGDVKKAPAAARHKRPLSRSSLRRANWCSAGVKTKAPVMSLDGVLPPPPNTSLYAHPLAPLLPIHYQQPLSWHNALVAAEVLNVSATSAMTKNYTVSHLRGSLVKTADEYPSPFPTMPCDNNWTVTHPSRCLISAYASVWLVF